PYSCGTLHAIAHYRTWGQMANKPEPSPKYDKVIEKSDDRNEAGNQLHGAEEIAHSARSYRAGVPGCARVLENHPDDTYLALKRLLALSPRLAPAAETIAAIFSHHSPQVAAAR